MNLPDANILRYAVNESDPKHDHSRLWLDPALNEGETTGLAWVVVLAFLRRYQGRAFPAPLRVDRAVGIVRDWLAQPASVHVDPSPATSTSWPAYSPRWGTGANLVNDAHLAALALERDATIVTYGTDFARFNGVRWRAPEPRHR